MLRQQTHPHANFICKCSNLQRNKSPEGKKKHAERMSTGASISNAMPDSVASNELQPGLVKPTPLAEHIAPMQALIERPQVRSKD